MGRLWGLVVCSNSFAMSCRWAVVCCRYPRNPTGACTTGPKFLGCVAGPMPWPDASASRGEMSTAARLDSSRCALSTGVRLSCPDAATLSREPQAVVQTFRMLQSWDQVLRMGRCLGAPSAGAISGASE